MIAAWLSGKISGLIIFCLACLSVVLLPMLVVQTVRIDGFDLAGWYVVKGFRPLYLQDENDLKTLRTNQDTLKAGIATCNGSVDALKKIGDARVADAQSKIAAAEGRALSLQAIIIKLENIKSTNEVCPVADQILRAGFQ